MVALVLMPALANAVCTLGVVNVSFGAYDSLSLVDSEIVGSIIASCDVESNAEVTLSSGAGSFEARRMQSATDSLFYNLYLDPTRLVIWGDGSPGTGVLSFNGFGATFPVYGRIPARQSVPAGSYADTIIVTLTF
jgi:spore coat protein U-like protein